jgi:hypothetical protein
MYSPFVAPKQYRNFIPPAPPHGEKIIVYFLCHMKIGQKQKNIPTSNSNGFRVLIVRAAEAKQRFGH